MRRPPDDDGRGMLREPRKNLHKCKCGNRYTLETKCSACKRSDLTHTLMLREEIKIPSGGKNFRFGRGMLYRDIKEIIRELDTEEDT